MTSGTTFAFGQQRANQTPFSRCEKRTNWRAFSNTALERQEVAHYRIREVVENVATSVAPRALVHHVADETIDNHTCTGVIVGGGTNNRAERLRTRLALDAATHAQSAIEVSLHEKRRLLEARLIVTLAHDVFGNLALDVRLENTAQQTFERSVVQVSYMLQRLVLAPLRKHLIPNRRGTCRT